LGKQGPQAELPWRNHAAVEGGSSHDRSCPDTAPPRRLDGIVRDPALRAAIGYWDSLRGARCLPARMDLDPGMLRPHLQDAAILEVAGPGSLRIRLGGARINALLGMDVRGLPLRALFDLSERARVSDRGGGRRSATRGF
jgi:hypothetical protein